MEGFRRLELLADAVDALVATVEIKRRFLGLAKDAARWFRAALPDVRAQEFRPRVKLLSVLADRIRALEPPADISLAMKQIEALLDESIEAEGYAVGESGRYSTDLSAIDFEKLAAKFERSRKRTFKERLTVLLVRRVETMVRENPTRVDYLEKLQAGIDAYNAGSANVEEHVRRLFEFAEELNEEERRAYGENLDQEELAVFDLLTKPEMELTPTERRRVKATARELLETLKTSKLTLDWRKRRQARADVRVTIEKHLDAGLPDAYTPELFQQKASVLFQHVYASYYGAGESVYEAA